MSLVSLKTELRQDLKLTPQLLQSMEILQMNSQELLEYLNRVSEENPVVEQEDSSALRSAYEELRQKASWIDAGVHGGTFTHEDTAMPERGAADREVESLSALDFSTALTISTVCAWVLWLLFFTAALAAVRKTSRKRRKAVL